MSPLHIAVIVLAIAQFGLTMHFRRLWKAERAAGLTASVVALVLRGAADEWKERALRAEAEPRSLTIVAGPSLELPETRTTRELVN